jgi:hypothetical protein
MEGTDCAAISGLQVLLHTLGKLGALLTQDLVLVALRPDDEDLEKPGRY